MLGDLRQVSQALEGPPREGERVGAEDLAEVALEVGERLADQPVPPLLARQRLGRAGELDQHLGHLPGEVGEGRGIEAGEQRPPVEGRLDERVPARPASIRDHPGDAGEGRALGLQRSQHRGLALERRVGLGGAGELDHRLRLASRGAEGQPDHLVDAALAAGQQQ